MHYYKRNLGDYYKKAGRLSMLEHGAYTLLQDACYDRETFPTRDEAIEWCWASTTEEVEAVDFVLNRFFRLKANGRYVQKRISEELEAYHARCKTNKQNRAAAFEDLEPEGNESKPKLNGSSTNRQRGDSKSNATKNQEPRTTKKINGDFDKSAAFNEFWAKYPRKVGKVEARKRFAVKIKNPTAHGKCMQGLDRYIKKVWHKTPSEFIPYPATWLGGERWSDDIKDAPQESRVGAMTETQLIEMCEKHKIHTVGLTTEQVKTKLERFIARSNHE